MEIIRKIKIIVAIIIGLSIGLYFSSIYAKYLFQNEFCIANVEIDRTKPKIDVVYIKNTNSDYPNYASKKHSITVELKVFDRNLKEVYLNEKYVKVKINENYIENPNMNIIKVKQEENSEIYDIKLTDLQDNGNLKLEVLEGAAIDLGGLKSEFLEINTNIIIDNIIPTGKLVENKISDGKVNAVVNLSEQIRNVNGWNMSDNKLNISKEFTNNVSYELPIMDFAGNEGKVDINIKQATFINIVYASHNSEVGWTFGYGNYDIAGKRAAQSSTKFKTEALAFNISGNVESDFVQANAFVYTYWGEGSSAKCDSSGTIYKYGYNPSENTYKSMKSQDLVNINGKQYFQFGGSGINRINNTDVNGNNAMPGNVAWQYLYGVSSIRFKLKDYSQFSIIYQILVDKVGWTSSFSDGQECKYSRGKPMCAFRVALVPKTEKQYVIDTWNKDAGTFNLDRK